MCKIYAAINILSIIIIIILELCNIRPYFVDLYVEIFRNLIKLDICDFLHNNLVREVKI